VRRAGTFVLVLGLLLSGCGESTGDSAEPSPPPPPAAEPAPPDIDFAEYELPADEAEGDEWTREHLDLYVRTYEHLVPVD
jgi:hypothetical protein